MLALGGSNTASNSVLLTGDGTRLSAYSVYLSAVATLGVASNAAMTSTNILLGYDSNSGGGNLMTLSGND
jgi:hypothetical protein